MEEEMKFNLTQARSLVPWIQQASQEAEQKVINVRNNEEDPEKVKAQLQYIIHYWAETVMKLGAIPKQPFTVDFNTGSDYFCWEYPEDDIYFRHGYQDGYIGRQKIED